ncbi:MAG: lanthionine synthetase LanC family protein [Acidobacteriota bacterium]|nr:lanthionine synthetase LanC family protein [Acidobacteriota bacterium]
MFEEALRIGRTLSTRRAETAELHMGEAGIALFFTELYRQSGDASFLEAAKQRAETVVSAVEQGSVRPGGFHLGLAGVAFMLLRLQHVSGETGRPDRVLPQLLAGMEKLSRSGADDFMGGKAGSLVGLIHLHRDLGDDTLLAAMDRLLGSLLERAVWHDAGLCWWTGNGNTGPAPCGFGHGNSGIGFALLELGRYLNRPVLYRLAERAFAYERSFYDARTGTWPDLRFHIDPDSPRYRECREAASRFDAAPFIGDRDFTFWCHGAAGIGLARLRGWELTGNAELREDAERALAHTRIKTLTQPDHPAVFTLCHGRGGNAALFLEAARVTSDESAREAYEQIAEDCLSVGESRRGYYPSGTSPSGDGPPHDSLMMGLAGIGYFYLRVLDPEGTPCILAPRSDAVFRGDMTAFPNLNATPSQLKRRFLHAAFPRTTAALDETLEEAAISDGASLHPATFMDRLFESETNVAPEVRRIRDEENALFQKIASVCPALLDMRRSIYKEGNEALSALDDADLEARRLQLAPEVVVLSGSMSENETPVMVHLTPGGKRTYPLPDVMARFFRSFSGGALVSEQVNHVSRLIAGDHPESVQEARAVLLQQIRQGLQGAVFVQES